MSPPRSSHLRVTDETKTPPKVLSVGPTNRHLLPEWADLRWADLMPFPSRSNPSQPQFAGMGSGPSEIYQRSVTRADPITIGFRVTLLLCVGMATTVLALRILRRRPSARGFNVLPTG